MSTEEASWPAQPAPIKKTVAWSEGRICDLADARVPLEDRGVLFGEAVYEAMLTRRGGAFAEESHLRRLAASAAGAGIDFAAAEPAVRDAIAALIAAGGEGDGLLYLQVTGGVAPRDHVPPSSGLTPGVYATLRPFDHMALGEAQRAGIAVVTMPDPRWSGARFKTTQLLGNVKASARP